MPPTTITSVRIIGKGVILSKVDVTIIIEIDTINKFGRIGIIEKNRFCPIRNPIKVLIAVRNQILILIQSRKNTGV